MEIIAVTAPGGKGKTSSINLAAKNFYQKACKMGLTPIVCIGNLQELQPRRNHTIIFEVPKCKFRIAFASSGDSQEIVDKNIEDARNNNCNVLVTAVRSKGRPVWAITAYCKNDKTARVVWLRPAMLDWGQPGPVSDPNSCTELHELSAKHIFEVVSYLVKIITPPTT